MCSIGGFFSFSPITDKVEALRLATSILQYGESRGSTATGIALINTKTGLSQVYKKPVSGVEFVKDEKFKKLLTEEEYNCVLLHNRLPTQGGEHNKMNNHPIFLREHNSILIHNGSVSNYEQLKRMYELKTDGEVDSEIILHLYHKIGIENAVKDMTGTFTFALYHDNKLNLLKHTNPLALAYVKERDMFLFASEREFIEGSITKIDYYYGLFPEFSKREGYETVSFIEPEENEHIVADFKTNNFYDTTLETTGYSDFYNKYNSTPTNKKYSSERYIERCNCPRCRKIRKEDIIYTGVVEENGVKYKYRTFKRHRKYNTDEQNRKNDNLERHIEGHIKTQEKYLPSPTPKVHEIPKWEEYEGDEEDDNGDFNFEREMKRMGRGYYN